MLKKFSLQKVITSLYSKKLSKIKTVISVLGMDLVSIKRFINYNVLLGDIHYSSGPSSHSLPTVP